MDASHHVMNHRTDRNHLVDRVEVDVLGAQFADEGKFLINQLRPQVADGEMDVVAIRPFERAALLLLLD